MAVNFERWCVRSSDALNGAINNSVTSIVLHDASGFPTDPYFHVLINNELMYVTGVSSNTFTVTRAREGTIASSHSDSAVVYGVLTGDSLDKRLSNIIQVGPFSNIFISESTGKGRIYISTDNSVMHFDSGIDINTLFESWQPISYWNDNSHWINQGSSSYSTGYFLMVNSGGLGDNIRANWLSNIGHTNGLVSRIVPILQDPSTDYYEYGVLVFDDSSGKFITLSVKVDNGVLSVNGDKYTDATTKDSSYFQMFVTSDQIRYICIQDDGATNINWKIGPNKNDMTQIFSVSRTDFTSGLNRIGVFGNPRPSGSTLKIYDYYNVIG